MSPLVSLTQSLKKMEMKAAIPSVATIVVHVLLLDYTYMYVHQTQHILRPTYKNSLLFYACTDSGNQALFLLRQVKEPGYEANVQCIQTSV